MPDIPTLGKSVVSSFVSPDYRDKLVYIDLDSRNGSYQPLDYGTAHPDATRYSDYVLIYQTPLKDDDTKVRRFYAAPRLNQDAYNFTIEYPHGNTSYPQYIRTYILPRDTYAPVAPGTADPVVAALGLIGQQYGRSEDPKIDTYFVIVRRTYGRLPTPLLSGQEYDYQWDFSPATFVENFRTAGSNIGDDYTDITPIDTIQQKTRVYSPNHAAILAFSRAYGSTHNMNLPDVLNSIQILWEDSEGIGSYQETGYGDAGGDRAQLSLSLGGTAQSSRSIIPQLKPDIDSPASESIPTTDYYFFLPEPTEGNVLGKLQELTGSSVSRWPIFHAKRHSFILRGQKTSLAVRVVANCNVYIDSSSASYAVSEGVGKDVDIASSIVRVDLPPTIHGDIEVDGVNLQILEITAAAEAGTEPTTNWPGASASISESAFAIGSVFPTELAATTPDSIPSTGLYLVDTNFSAYRYGYVAVMARVLNANVLS